METEKQGGIKLQMKIKVFEILAEYMSLKTHKIQHHAKILESQWKFIKTIW